MSKTSTFLDACLYGVANVGDVDDWVDRWHDAAGAPDGEQVSLADYLGLTEAEYDRWMTDGSTLKDVLVQRAYQHRSHTVQYLGDSTWTGQSVVEITPNALTS